MTDPNDLLDAIVAAWRSNSTLVATLLASNQTNLSAYRYVAGTGVNLESAIIGQKPPTIMVAWRGTRTGYFAKLETIKHDFAAYLKPPASVTIGAAFVLLRESVCSTSGLKFKLTNVHDSVHPPDSMKLEPKSIYVAQGYGIHDFAELSFTLTERGIDN